MARAFRFVHAADLHLDSPFKGLAPMPDRLRDRVIQSGFEAWEALVRLTLDYKADALLLCGDLHDSESRSLRSQWRLQQGMEKLVRAGVSVFIQYGNHDPMDGKLDWQWPEGVVVMSTERPESYWIRNRSGWPTAVVTGMSYGTQAVYDNLASKYPIEPERYAQDTMGTTGHQVHGQASEWEGRRLFRIGMLHGTVDGIKDHDPYAPCSKQELIEKGYDYWALGHIHKREVLHQSPWIVYPGNLQGRHIKETGAKGAYIVDVDEDGSSELHFHALELIRWHEVQVSIDGIETRQELMDKLWQLVEQWREEGDVPLYLVRATLTGKSALHRELMCGVLIQELEEMWKEAELQRLEQGDNVVWPVAVRADSRTVTDIAAWRESEHFMGEAIRLTEQAASDNHTLEQWMEEALQPLRQQRVLARWTEELSDEQRRELLDEALHLVVEMLEGEPNS